MSDRIITLDEFILNRQSDFPYASGELSGLLHDIGLAAKIVNREVNRAGLVNILGAYGAENASGETVQKLDMYANDRLIECLKNSGECCGIASEENESFVTFPVVASKHSKYVVLFDPLDGSSNIDINASVGTIFSIYRRKSDVKDVCNLEDFLQAGSEQVAAGYVLFGTSTILVYSTGKGVNGFTLDPSIGEFCLSHKDITIPEKGKYYAINYGNHHHVAKGVQVYADDCCEKQLRLRYIGAMVADIHRTLLKGGIFIYPNTSDYPTGRLRLLYECNPLAFLIEQAGGKAITTDLGRIMEVQPTELHQRVSVALGSASMIDDFAACIKEHGNELP